MTYSMVTMRSALEAIGFTHDARTFVWEASGGVHTALREAFRVEAGPGRFAYARGNNLLNDLLEYCWLVYSKALNARGPQQIGRTHDLWVPYQLERSGLSKDDHSTLWDPHARGNIQKMDKWAPVVNDCWVLGGVHRRADYELVSVRSPQNLWDMSQGFHVVTARELFGLLHFGYEFDLDASPVRLVCRESSRAQSATIEEYTALMKEKQELGPNGVRALIQMDPRLRSQIESFDRSKLRHVDPPR
jgi:hypothetical protein